MLRCSKQQLLEEAKRSRLKLEEELGKRDADLSFFIEEQRMPLADYLQKEIAHDQHHIKQIAAFKSRLQV
jgi:hypothetical protein